VQWKWWASHNMLHFATLVFLQCFPRYDEKLISLKYQFQKNGHENDMRDIISWIQFSSPTVVVKNHSLISIHFISLLVWLVSLWHCVLCAISYKVIENISHSSYLPQCEILNGRWKASAAVACCLCWKDVGVVNWGDEIQDASQTCVITAEQATQ